MSKARQARRFGREDWVELGLSLLSSEGLDAMTVERLTAAAGKTRGSFYHHFEDHRAFLAALADAWLARQTDEVIAEADAALRSGRRRQTLAVQTARIDHALERAMRRLASQEELVAEAVASSDERRINYLVRLFRSELGLPIDEATRRARIQHCFFVGAQLVFPDADPRFRLELQKTLGNTLWRPTDD